MPPLHSLSTERSRARTSELENVSPYVRGWEAPHTRFQILDQEATAKNQYEIDHPKDSNSLARGLDGQNYKINQVEGDGGRK